METADEKLELIGNIEVGDQQTKESPVETKKG